MNDLFTQAERFQIESGVPVTTDRSGPRKRRNMPQLPFDKMRVGDSFAVRPDDIGVDSLIRCQNAVTGAACDYRKREHEGFGYTSRQLGDSVRIWRTA